VGFAGGQISILDALLKLRQVCCDPHLLKGAKTPETMEWAKIELLREMLPVMVEEGRRILVFSQFTEMLTLIEAELPPLKLTWLTLTGDTPSAERGEVVRQFQALAVPILLVSLKAGGVGLNLTAADYVFILDPWWNPAAEAQAVDRAHRIGQMRNVFAYRLIARDTVEERVLELQQRKRALADAIITADNSVVRSLKREDLELILS